MKKDIPINLLEKSNDNIYELTSAMIKRVSQIIEIKNIDRKYKNKKREEDSDAFYENEKPDENETKSASSSIREILEEKVVYKLEEN